MNSGASATFGIRFSVTSSGISARRSVRDQVKSTASSTPMVTASAKPPKASAMVMRACSHQSICGAPSARSVSAGPGRMKRGTPP
ncbi:hypothetical protein [Falsiroseomonas sp. HW251]|uniref:hypothetical protein n=1 Tax=Falsiroseomonas sp. HW251 TaxID=3390998 RepID=UPI003D318107